MLCPKIRACKEYAEKRRFSSRLRFKCAHKEYWSRCPLYAKDRNEDGEKPAQFSTPLVR